MQFAGTYPYQMDKNRVPIPPGFRGAFETGGAVSTGTEPCLVLRTPEAFEEEAAAVNALPDNDDGDEARRDFFANSYPIQKDGQGRALLPLKLIDHAGLKKDVIVAGVGKQIEIWDRATWEVREEQRKAARRAIRNAQAASNAQGS
ncbi:MAG: cell division/cell wall cluster transcriptional repressor MraZ [Chloroflexi bacterium]|nr:cell division/cell wall cluster transcriptional repressor MraZ [Chloroflexota bacterium]